MELKKEIDENLNGLSDLMNDDLFHFYKGVVFEIAKAYASECCEAQRIACAENAEIHYPASNNLNPTVNRDSVLETPLVV